MIGGLLQPLASSIGAREDQLLLIVLLIINVPLCSVIPYLPGQSKHLFSIVLSWVFLWPLLELRWGYVQLVGQALVSFGLSKLGSRLYAKGTITFPWPWIVFFAAMGHLLGIHIHRHMTNMSGQEIEISQMMMVLVQRVTLFAWTAYDSSEKEAAASHKKSKSSSLPHKEADLPLLSFLGYCFFLPVFLAGPGIDYKSYVERTSSPVPSGRGLAAAKQLFVGLVFVAIFASLASSFSYSKMLEDAFLNLHPAMKVAFVNIAGFMARTKYYGVWLIAEASCITSGIGRTLPVDGAVVPWSHASNVDIGSIELAENWKMLLASWNSWTNVWLRETVYIRVAKRDRKPGFKSTLTTFLVSALWHGVNTCYFMTFVMGALVQALAKQMRRWVRPLTLPPPESANIAGKAEQMGDVAEDRLVKMLYDVFGCIATQCMLNYIVMPFILLDVSTTIAAWSRVWYYGHFLTFVPLVLFKLGGRSLLKSYHPQHTLPKPRAADQTAEGAAPKRVDSEPLLVGHGEDLAKMDEELDDKVEDEIRRLRSKGPGGNKKKGKGKKKA